jgi:hypothetical protein
MVQTKVKTITQFSADHLETAINQWISNRSKTVRFQGEDVEINSVKIRGMSHSVVQTYTGSHSFTALIWYETDEEENK